MSSLTGSGFLTKGIDGALYAYTDTATANTNSLTKSTRWWPHLDVRQDSRRRSRRCCHHRHRHLPQRSQCALHCHWRELCGSPLTAAPPSPPQPVGAIPAATSLAVGLLGGSYKVFAGTSGGVFLFDEGVSLNNKFVLFGGTGGLHVLDVKLSPTFNTAAGIYALYTAGGADLWVSTGGAFADNPCLRRLCRSHRW